DRFTPAPPLRTPRSGLAGFRLSSSTGETQPLHRRRKVVDGTGFRLSRLTTAGGSRVRGHLGCLDIVSHDMLY
ncbi:hypothetical protein LEMLEM_LOCUS8496, partial [Lemmus lemmus]